MGGASGGRGEVPLDVVAAAEEQRDEHGSAAGVPEGVAEQRAVQLDVSELDVEAGAELTDPVEEGQDGGEGAGIAAAVRDGDEGGLHAGTPSDRPPPRATGAVR